VEVIGIVIGVGFAALIFSDFKDAREKHKKVKRSFVAFEKTIKDIEKKERCYDYRRDHFYKTHPPSTR